MRPAASTLAVILAMRAALAAQGLGDNPATFDQQIDRAMVTRDIAFLNAVVADDARFGYAENGSSWTKREWLEAVKRDADRERTVEAVQVEPRGDIARTRGR